MVEAGPKVHTLLFITEVQESLSTQEAVCAGTTLAGEEIAEFIRSTGETRFIALFTRVYNTVPTLG